MIETSKYQEHRIDKRLGKSSLDALLESLVSEIAGIGKDISSLNARLGAVEALMGVADRIARSKVDDISANYPNQFSIEANHSALSSPEFHHIEYNEDGDCIRWTGPDSKFSFTLAREEGRDLSHDWTEVVLLGMRPEQDTVASPYDEDPPVGSYWLPETLYGRFFRIADDIEIVVAPGLTWRPTPQRFLTLAQRARTAFAGYECVAAPDGVRIHYFFDPVAPDRPWENASSEGALQTAIGQVGVVHRNEIYDRSFGSPWAYEAPNFGVTFGGRHVSVFIELPDDYPVRPDAYRQVLMDVSGEQNVVRAGRFAALALKSRPGWLIDAIDGMGGKRRRMDNVVDDLARLSGRLNLEALGPADPEAKRDEEATDVAAAERTSKARSKCGFEIVLLRDEREINDRWLLGRAACFYASTKELFVNTLYPSVAAAESALLARLADLRKIPFLDDAVHEAAIDCLVTKVGRALLYAMSKHFDRETWHPGHIEKAMSPEALSIAADDLEDLLPVAETQIREAMKAAI